MKKLIYEVKGAVTVFVTLLLIPAILVSGTAVDLVRLHTAKSIVQDANQLAANSVLSQYNALLQDLYGIYGIAEDDPILAELLDEYISITIFGRDNRDVSLGTLQLFYGSNITQEEFCFTDGKDLSQPDVLRRQIEEYMKYRGPVQIVLELLELLSSGTFKEDAEVIEDKLKVDETIAEIYELYRNLYDAIVLANGCVTVGKTGNIAGTVGNVSTHLGLILDAFKTLRDRGEAWQEEEDPEEKEKLASIYNELLVNVKIRTVGGKPVSFSDDGNRKSSSSTVEGLNKIIENSIERAVNFKPNFDKVVEIAREIDLKKEDLRRQVDVLEQRIASGDCNAELKEALTEKTGEPPKSMIERYRDILKWNDIESMAQVFKDGGYHYIDEILIDLLESVMYRNRSNSSAPSLSRAELEKAQSDSRFALSGNISGSLVARLAGYTSDNIAYKIPEGFKKFAEYTGNADFWDELVKMMAQPDLPPISLYEEQEDAGGGDAEEKQRNIIDDLLNIVNSAYDGLTNNPLGAKYVNIETSESSSNDEIGVAQSVSQANSHPVSSVISSPYSSVKNAADYLLLLTYCTSIFSNYTTSRPEITGKSIDDISDVAFGKSITGIPISPHVNYFFQSEWEYLYHGDSDAANNLSAVSKLIYIVRIIFNYITVFSVTEVTSIVNAIRAAFSFCPPLGIVLGELARGVFVMAESAVDLATLRAGYKVPLIKSAKNGQWVCSPSGVVNALSNAASGTFGNSDEDGKGITYSNYLLFFFIAKGLGGDAVSDELARRTATLIELNVINYKDNILCDEEKMTQALSEAGRFKLSDMKTDFYLTTTVDMRMLFLSMLFAQNFSDSRGLGMPSQMPVSVTDYRGY
ncbi:MAG: DUF5702 domain-containing protein [Oscillospiraceae bacterium]|nr:DUF5702 domain-containing protein [Oscillospiraceae bacterium]